jgi:Kef-type K+ transport system membrane component KefB
MAMKLILLLLLGGLMHAARLFVPEGIAAPEAAATALACGYLILTGFFSGQIFKTLGLPKLTGYLAAGIIVGPQVLGLVSKDMLGSLKVFNGVAIALIALTAGIEMHIPSIRPLFRNIMWITGVAVVGTTIVLIGTIMLIMPLMPFTQGFSTLQQAAIALVLGVATVAQSPAVVVALRDETRADGPMMRTVMAVVVIADLVVITLFAIAMTTARSIFGSGGDALEAAGTLAWEFIGSGVMGLAIGVLIGLYLSRVKGGGALFVIAVAFVIAEVGNRLHLDPLLVALSAGAFIRNATNVGDRLHHEIESASLPVYVTFFALAGAKVQLDALVLVGVPAIIIVVVRALGFWGGNHVAARITKAPDALRKYGGVGLMPQAGLALALGILVERNFPGIGAELGVLVLGVVALNELIMPIVLRIALIRSGEAGKLGEAPEPTPTELDAVAGIEGTAAPEGH